MSYSNIIFPSNLAKNNSSFVLLTGQQWGTKYKKDKTVKSQTLNDYISIALPLPEGGGPEDSTYHNWDSAEGALLNIKESGGKMAVKGLIDSAKQALGNLVTGEQFKIGETINDYASLMYGGQSARIFNFVFGLVPENQQDAKKINEIIKALKYGSLPELRGVKVGYPFFWKVKIYNAGIKKIEYKSAVIKSLEINKFPEDSPVIHKDGESIKTNITITFNELYKEWRNEYK